MPVDPQEFGQIQGQVQHLRDDINRLTGMVQGLSGQINELRESESRRDGGWKMLVGMLTASGALGALISSWLANVFHIGPPVP